VGGVGGWGGGGGVWGGGVWGGGFGGDKEVDLVLVIGGGSVGGDAEAVEDLGCEGHWSGVFI